MSYAKKEWYYKQMGMCAAYDIYNPNRINGYVCSTCGLKDAQHIITCVNSHDELVKALKDAQDHLEDCGYGEKWDGR